MSRYIDADKLEELCGIMAEKCDDVGESIWNQFRTTVKWSPTADVVPKEDVINELINEISDRITKFLETNYELIPKKPQVQCKDCKYYNHQHNFCEGIGYWFGRENEWSDNGFCYKGERINKDD